MPQPQSALSVFVPRLQPPISSFRPHGFRVLIARSTPALVSRPRVSPSLAALHGAFFRLLLFLPTHERCGEPLAQHDVDLDSAQRFDCLERPLAQECECPHAKASRARVSHALYACVQPPQLRVEGAQPLP